MPSLHDRAREITLREEALFLDALIWSWVEKAPSRRAKVRRAELYLPLMGKLLFHE